MEGLRREGALWCCPHLTRRRFQTPAATAGRSWCLCGCRRDASDDERLERWRRHGAAPQRVCAGSARRCGGGGAKGGPHVGQPSCAFCLRRRRLATKRVAGLVVACTNRTRTVPLQVPAATGDWPRGVVAGNNEHLRNCFRFVSDGPSAPGRRLVPSSFKAHAPTPPTLASSLRVDPVGGYFVAAQKGGRACRPGRELLLWPMATGSVLGQKIRNEMQ